MTTHRPPGHTLAAVEVLEPADQLAAALVGGGVLRGPRGPVEPGIGLLRHAGTTGTGGRGFR